MIKYPFLLVAAWMKNTLFAGGLFIGGVAVLITLVAVFGDLTMSVWEQAQQVTRWYALVIGCSLTYAFLPLFVAYGQTRRMCFYSIAVFLPIFPAILAAVVSLGFLAESGVYGLGGWPETYVRPHLFNSSTELGMIFVEYWLILAAWMTAGALIAGGFYRSRALGFALIPAGAALAGAVEFGAGPRHFVDFPPIDSVEFAGTPFAATGAALAGVALGLAIIWLMVRDVPLRISK